MLLTYYFGISSSLRLGSDNETNLLEDTLTYHSTETHCPLSRVHITLYDVPPSTQTFWMTIILDASPAYATSTKHFQKHDDTEEQYVERLRKELEGKLLGLGPETVIGCTNSNLSDVFKVQH